MNKKYEIYQAVTETHPMSQIFTAEALVEMITNDPSDETLRRQAQTALFNLGMIFGEVTK